MPFSERWLALAALSFVVLCICLIGMAAQAHDHDRPDLNGWFMTLHNKNHVACCDGSDATSLDDPDWENNNGHYRVKLNDRWVDVPDEAVIDSPNRDGRAMVWPYYINGQLIGVRCFLPGAGA